MTTPCVSETPQSPSHARALRSARASRFLVELELVDLALLLSAIPLSFTTSVCVWNAARAARMAAAGELMPQLQEHLALLGRQAVEEEELGPARTRGRRVASWRACRRAREQSEHI